MTKMTEKEMYEVIKGIVAGSEFEAEIVELCDRKIKQIEKAKERKAAKAEEEKPDPIRDIAFSIISTAEEPMTADMVMEEISEEDIVKFVINIYKVRKLLSALVRDGMIYKSAHTVNKKVAYTFKPDAEEKAETETESKEE